MVSVALPQWRAALASARLTRWPIRRLGPYFCVTGFSLLTVLCLTLSRLALIAWQWDRLPTHSLTLMLMQGLRNDVMTVSMCAAPPVLVLPLFLVANRTKLWEHIAGGWFAGCLIVVVFLELATPQFLIEYDTRPNRLFIEYLRYPKEIGAMLWNGYRGTLLLTIVVIAAVGWLVIRHFRRYPGRAVGWRMRTATLVWPLVAIVLFMAIRSSVQHRPANLASFAFFDDAMVNSLVVNSTFSVLSAVYDLKNEGQSSEIYGSLPFSEMVLQVRAGTGTAGAAFSSDRFPTLHHQTASVVRDKPLNLVIVLEESLGAGFVRRLGGEPVTPNLERLAAQGIWFNQLYATGTRSVRGIEAVVAGFPPTPALSVVKLAKSQQNFATLASVLRRAGFQNEFIYGGASHFDNMRGFFLGNGFHSIVDRKDFAAPKFVGSWGVSDEDLFGMADQRIRALGATRQPFFMLVFSSSNHSPFEFPDGRVEQVDAEKHTVNNAVHYADHALGQFMDRARRSDYWANTLFVVVADHDTRVYGQELVPVSKFHIPGLILGADVQPRVVDSVVSQIDLAPTLLSLLGVDSDQPFFGRDLTRTLPEFGNSPAPVTPRAMMMFDRNYAWLEDNHLTVLLPDGSSRQFEYDPGTRKLENAPANPEAARRALAHVLMPAWLYREQRYRQ